MIAARNRLVAAWLLLAGLLLASCTHAPPPQATLGVMTSGGFTAAFDRIAPTYEAEHNIRLLTVYGASIGGAPDSIPARLARGEPADVVILARQGMDRLVAQGLVDGPSVIDLVRSQIGMAIPVGALRPDISTPQGFENTLLRARRIGYSASASGTYLAEELLPRLSIYPLIRDRLVRIESERVASVVARGEVDIGFQQVSEILPIAGAEFAGLIPEQYQRTTVFSAGITSGSLRKDQAEQLLRFLTDPRHEQLIRQTGLEPIRG